jgi:hypothetical protein
LLIAALVVGFANSTRISFFSRVEFEVVVAAVVGEAGELEGEAVLEDRRAEGQQGFLRG